MASPQPDAQQPDARRIFLEAVEKHAPERWPVFLDEACRDRGELRKRVEALLSAHGGYNAMLDGVGLVPTLDTQLAERPGSQIGPYKLLQQIGEGGFGVVFMAEQSEPLRRRVALKVIKPGMDTRQVIARFEAERQALAVMDHPNIARVLDGGATESGRPYFVMELVRGIPITQFCDENSLSVRERLSLFATVCQAIQHAHTKGIIHRDIKPSNVLVTRQDGEAAVKVIDFGIAKAMGQQLTEKTLFTDFAAMIGTPLYMSPEQAELSGADIDTRSDIYSLGVLLYELLTGSTPVSKEKMKQAAFDEVRRIIREDEPERPSTRVGTSESAPSIAAQRHSEPAKLARLMRGELDWIVMKSLDKDRNRRYETASGFAADVERYLNDEAVQACPPSARYRLRKFARKNRGLLAASVTIAALLVFGAVGAVVAAIQSNQLAGKERDLRSAAEKQAKTEAAARAELDQKLYINLIALTQQELYAQNLGRAHELLDQTPTELRGWEWRFLRRFGPGNPRLLSENRRGATFSPNGQFLAARRDAPAIDLYDSSTGELVRAFPGIESFVEGYGIDFHPDAARGIVAAGDYRGKFVKIWDVNTGKVLRTLEGHGDRLRCVEFSPDGKRLAVGAIAKGAKIWNWETGELAFELPKLGVSRFAYSFDGERLAISVWGREKDVVVVNAESGRELLSFAKHAGGVEAVVYSPKAPLIATCGSDGIVNLWDDATGKLRRSIRGHTGPVLDVAFTSDGKRLASGGWDKSIKLWDVATGQETLTLRGHSNMVVKLEFSADDSRLVSAGDAEIMIWDATPDSKEAKSGAIDVSGHTDFVTSVAYSPDGRHLASAGRDGSIQLTGAASLREGKKPESISLRAESSLGMSLVFRPDSKRLAASSWESGEVKVWDPETALETPLAHRQRGGPYIAYSPDGLRLASTGPGVIAECDSTTGESLWRMKLATGAIYGLSYSPVGRFIAACDHHYLPIWDVEKKEIVKRFNHPSSVWACAFDPLGERIATACSDHAVRVWSVGEGRELRVLSGHGDKVLSVAFSADGAWLASGAADGAVKVWETASGRELATFRGHTGYVWSVAFRPDGKQLASGGGHDRVGEVKVWSLVETLAATGEAALSRRRREAAAFHRVLAASQPKVWEHRRNLANAYAQNGEIEEAKSEYLSGVELSPESLTKIVDSLAANIGPEKCQEFVVELAASYEKSSAAIPSENQAQAWRYLADGLDRIGGWHKGEGRRDAAHDAHRQAIAVYDSYLKRFPASNPDNRLKQSFRCNDLAFALPPEERGDLGQQLVRRAIELKQALVDEFPKNAWYKFHLAHSHLGLGLILVELRREPEASEENALAGRIFKAVAADGSAEAELLSQSAHGLWRVGEAWEKLPRHDEAKQAYEIALTAFARLEKTHPTNRFYRQEQGFSHRLLARLAERAGRYSDAIPSQRDAVAIYQKLSDEVPDSKFYRDELAYVQMRMVEFLIRDGRPGAAEPHLVGAIENYAKSYELSPGDPAKQRGFAEWLNNLTWPLAMKPKSSEESIRLATAMSKRSLELHPSAGHLWNTAAMVRYRAGDWQEARAAYDKAKELGFMNVTTQFFGAMIHWRLGELDEARQNYKLACEAIDERNPAIEGLALLRLEVDTLIDP